MSALFWMTNTADSRCGDEGTLQKGAYYTESYNNTAKFFDEGVGHPGSWTVFFEETPCDIARTPFHPIVSAKFVEIANTLGISAEYYPVAINISGEILERQYFFPIPNNKVSAIDRNSPRVRITDSNSRTPNWIESFSYQKSSISYKAIGNRHWSQERDTFGRGWIVSEDFKNSIESNKLTGFNFFEAKPSPNL